MFFKVTNEDPYFKELAYLNMVYVLGGLSLGFYIVRFNWVYDFSQFNILMIPLYAMMLSGPWIYKKWSSFIVSSLLVLVPAYLLVFTLVSLSGGLLAPGVHWFATLPIILGFLYGRFGLWLGVVLLTLVTGVLGLVDYSGLSLDIIKSAFYQRQERIINVILFFIFICANSAYFLFLEERYVNLVKAKKQESDSLLRVLMHDFSTPLTILQIESMKLESLDSQAINPEVPAKIRRTIETMSSLLMQIRELRALKGNQHFHDFILVDLNAALKDVVALLAPTMTSRRISINLDIPDGDLPIVADERGLRDIVLHTILTNAVLSSPDDTWVDVRVFKKTIDEKSFYLLEVHDYGEPFSEDQVRSIFSLEDKVTKISRLGELAYAFPLMKGYLEKVAARVEVTSFAEQVNGRGNRITVYFPLD